MDLNGNMPDQMMLLSAVGPMAVIGGDWLQKEDRLYPRRSWLRWSIYTAIATAVLFCWDDASNQFIYFQF